MATVKVLRVGYSDWLPPARQRAAGTVTLVRGKKNVVVDTGIPRDKEIILEALKKENLTPKDIDYVVCTTGHTGHIGNINLFPNAISIIAYDVLSDGDLFSFHDYSKQAFTIEDEIKVIPTPGHSHHDISVLAETDHGWVAIVGDLFEKKEDLDDKAHYAPFSELFEIQVESRNQILQQADFIVPGHGDLFQVENNVTEEYQAEGQRHKIRHKAAKIVNTNLEDIPVTDLADIVMHALKNKSEPAEIEKNPIDRVFSSLYGRYRRPLKTKFNIVSHLLEKELEEFNSDIDFTKDSEKRTLYVKLIRLRYFENLSSEETWKHLGSSKTPYYKNIKDAANRFSDFLRKREFMMREMKGFQKESAGEIAKKNEGKDMEKKEKMRK